MATARKRKAKEAEPIAEQPFTVGADDPSPVAPEEEAPDLRPETVDGIAMLRGHLEQRAPQLLWPLQTMPSMHQHLSDLESAREATDSLAIRHALSSTKLGELRHFLLSDAYAFNYAVCKHHDIVPEVHMAMAYAAAGQAGKLAWLMTQSGFDGYVIDCFREQCRSRSIDPATQAGVYTLDSALDWIDMRWPRGVYKSSTITHGGATITATRDPDSTALVTGAIDDKAFEIVAQVGATVTSGIFIDLFPDRTPKAARDCSKDHVTMQGRTISHRQTTLQGSGYIGKEISAHFDTFWTDDLVVRGPRGNATASALPGVNKWLSGMRGFFMLSRRVRRVSTGTMATEGDDFHWYTAEKRKGRCVSVVIPVETFPTEKFPDGPPKSVFVRGVPTMPTFPPVATPEAIDIIQRDVVVDETDEFGIENWLCDYRLVPAAAGGRMFEEATVTEQDRAWLGPFVHPKSLVKGGEKFKERFLVARLDRNEAGAPIRNDATKAVLDVTVDGWRKHAAIVSFDPFEEMDMILAVHSSWEHGARAWAATIAAVDSSLVRFQLETRIGDDGVEGWSGAVAELVKRYRPRVVGLDEPAHKDEAIQNRLRTDYRLRSLGRRVVGVTLPESTLESRVRASVAEPFKTFKLLLLPTGKDAETDFGASVTRREMLRFRADSDAPSPILNTFVMVDALMRRVSSREEREAARRARIEQRPFERVNEFGLPVRRVA